MKITRKHKKTLLWRMKFFLIYLFDGRYRREKRVNKSISSMCNLLEKNGFGARTFLTEEISYVDCAVRRCKEAGLPVIETESIIKVSQIPCAPLKFVPRKERRY